jgi:hypothetical protein
MFLHPKIVNALYSLPGNQFDRLQQFLNYLASNYTGKQIRVEDISVCSTVVQFTVKIPLDNAFTIALYVEMIGDLFQVYEARLVCTDSTLDIVDTQIIECTNNYRDNSYHCSDPVSVYRLITVTTSLVQAGTDSPHYGRGEYYGWKCLFMGE